VVVLSLLYFLFPASGYHFYPKCIFHQLTGLYCPGCGSQRAASALLHGNIGQAFGFNVLFVISLPFILYSAVVFCWNAFSDKKIRQRVFYSPVFVKTVLALVVGFAVLRNIPVSPFSWLAP
jgi:hypothetical protein